MSSASEREGDLWAALDSPDARQSAEAAFALAALHVHRGESESAREVLALIECQPNTALAAAAALRLARLHEACDETEEAALAYARAAHKADPEFSASVLLDLAARWAAQGDRERARLAYLAIKDRAARANDRSIAALRLADLAREAGELGAAIPLWRAALAGIDNPDRPHVAQALAEGLLAWEGECDHEEIVDLLETVIDSDHADLAPRAALEVAKLRRHRGELIEAYQYCQWVIESEHPVYQAGAQSLEEDLLDGEVDSLFVPDKPQTPEQQGLLPPVEPPERPAKFDFGQDTGLLLARSELCDNGSGQLIAAAKHWGVLIEGLRSGSALKWTAGSLSSGAGVDTDQGVLQPCRHCDYRWSVEQSDCKPEPEDAHGTPDFSCNRAGRLSTELLCVSEIGAQLWHHVHCSRFIVPSRESLLGLLGFVWLDEVNIDPLPEMRAVAERDLFDGTEPRWASLSRRSFSDMLLGAELRWVGFDGPRQSPRNDPGGSQLVILA